MKYVLSRLREEIEARLARKESIIIALDGSCTSGKTTLANALAEEYDCTVLRMDDFFLRPHQKTPARLAQTGGNVDHERFASEVLAPLRRGETFSYRPYDCGTCTLGEPVTVQPKRITLVEGSYSQHPCFGDAYDLRIYLTVTEELRRQRILQRPAFLHKRFFEEWIPMEQRYFREFAIRERADLVLDTGEDMVYGY